LEGRVNVDIENKNLLYALGLLLSERSCTSTSYPPDMSFYIRKYDPSIVPVFSIWDNKQIIEYYNGPRDDPGREKWEYELVDDMTTLSVSVDGETRYDLIKQMAMATMVHCRIDKQGGKEKILIGPLEIMDPCGRYQRRVYRLPEAPEWWDASAVPARLGSSALECAYDKATGILVLIGEPQYLVPYECLLRAAGAERIGAATGCPRDERHEGHSDAGTPGGDGEE
jgi:hypothetical protein